MRHGIAGRTRRHQAPALGAAALVALLPPLDAGADAVILTFYRRGLSARPTGAAHRRGEVIRRVTLG